MKEDVQTIEIDYGKSPGIILFACALASQIINNSFYLYMQNGEWLNAAFLILGTWIWFVFFCAILVILFDLFAAKSDIYKSLKSWKWVVEVLSCILFFSLVAYVLRDVGGREKLYTRADYEEEIELMQEWWHEQGYQAAIIDEGTYGNGYNDGYLDGKWEGIAFVLERMEVEDREAWVLAHIDDLDGLEIAP